MLFVYQISYNYYLLVPQIFQVLMGNYNIFHIHFHVHPHWAASDLADLRF